MLTMILLVDDCWCGTGTNPLSRSRSGTESESDGYIASGKLPLITHFTWTVLLHMKVAFVFKITSCEVVEDKI